MDAVDLRVEVRVPADAVVVEGARVRVEGRVGRGDADVAVDEAVPAGVLAEAVVVEAGDVSCDASES